MELETTKIQKRLNSIISRKDEIQDFDQQISSIIDEWSFIKDQIDCRIYKVKGRVNKMLFIREHQCKLTALCNLAYLSLSETAKVQPDVSKKIKDTLLWESIKMTIDLLEYIKLQFKGYFDNSLAVPNGTIRILKNKQRDKCKAIKVLMEKGEVERPLVELVQDYLNIEPGTGNSFSWKDIAYLQNVFDTFKGLILSNARDERNLENEFLGKLFYLNFNHDAFYGYLVGKIKQRVESKVTFKEQQRELLDILRVYQGFPVHGRWIYNPDLPDIRSAITSHINREIDYIHRVQQLYSEGLAQRNGRSSPSFYFKVSLTVAQLVFFVRLLVETGTVIAKSKADLNEFLVNHVGTLNKSNITERSIRSKSTRPDPSIVKNVKHVLISMLNLINEKYEHLSRGQHLKS